MGVLKKALVCLVLFIVTPLVSAGAFFETGRSQVNTTVDNGGWVTVNLQKSYTNPVVIAGNISHNNDNSLSVRVRNVTGSSFELGMQSPCQSYNRFANTTPPAANTCPSSPWVNETIEWMVVERGTWVFPDGTKVEAYLHTTSTVRSSSNSSPGADVSYSHSYSSPPAVLHTVNTYNDTSWINSSVWAPSTIKSSPPNTSGFRIALEGAEATTSHGAETIGWVAIEQSNGTNLGSNYVAGRTGGLDVDRHSDECQNITYGAVFSGTPNVISAHNTMNGGNGGWIRQCASSNSSSFNVHMDEDQVRDVERTGIPEYVSWFAFESGSFGALEFLSATKTVTDEDGDSVGGPGELLTYAVTITNLQDDFAQADNATSTNPEFTDDLDSNVTFDSVVSASSGSLTHNAGLNRMEWQGSVPPSGTVNLQYRVRVNEDMTICSLSNISNQGQLNMDSIDDSLEAGDIDNLNQITELTDDPSRDDGVDTDGDTLTDDDDSTIISADCLADISVTKSDASANFEPGQNSSYTIVITNAGPHSVVGIQVADTLPNGLSYNGAVSCNITTGSGSCGAQSISGQDYNQSISLGDNSSATIVIPVIYSSDPNDY